jgi:hypothetical protein
MWLLRPGEPAPRRALSAAGPGFLLVLLLALAVDPGSGGDWRHAIDRISLLYVALAVAICVIGAGAWALDRTSVRATPRAAAGVALGVLALGAWIVAFPSVLLGTDALVEPGPARTISSRIVEMMPVASVGDALRYLTGGIFATVVLAALALRRRSLPLGYATLCAVALVAFAAMHSRFSTYGAVLAAAVLVVVLSWITRANWGEGLAGAAARIGCIVLLLGVPVLPDLPMSGGNAVTGLAAAPDCSTRHIASLLGPYAGQVVLGDVNDSPELLYRTRVLTVGALYYRAAAGFVRLFEAWRSPGDTAEIPPAVRRTNATLVLACPGQGRTTVVEDLPPDTLFDRLNRDEPPPWLQRVGADAVGHVLYRVRPDAPP